MKGVLYCLYLGGHGSLTHCSWFSKQPAMNQNSIFVASLQICYSIWTVMSVSQKNLSECIFQSMTFQDEFIFELNFCSENKII